MTCCALHLLTGWSPAPCAGVNPDAQLVYGWTYSRLFASQLKQWGEGGLFGTSDGFGFGMGPGDGRGGGIEFDYPYGDGYGNSIGGGHGAGNYLIHRKLSFIV